MSTKTNHKKYNISILSYIPVRSDFLVFQKNGIIRIKKLSIKNKSIN